MEPMLEHFETSRWHSVETTRVFVAKKNLNEESNELLRYLQRSYFWGLVKVIWLPGNSLAAGNLNIHFSNISQKNKWRLVIFVVRDMNVFDITRHADYIDNHFFNFRNLNRECSIQIEKKGGFFDSNRFKKGWYRTFKKSKKKCNGFSVEPCMGSDDIISLYKDLKEIKNLKSSEVLDEHYIKSIFDLFSDELLVLKILNLEGFCIGIRGVIIHKNYAFDIFAATNSEGRSVGCSYVLIGELLKRLDEMEIIEFYDLNGVDPINNKGVFDFKNGLNGNLILRQGKYIRSNSKIGNFWLSFLGKFL